jgi:hypothetical protein
VGGLVRCALMGYDRARLSLSLILAYGR